MQDGASSIVRMLLTNSKASHAILASKNIIYIYIYVIEHQKKKPENIVTRPTSDFALSLKSKR